MKRLLPLMGLLLLLHAVPAAAQEDLYSKLKGIAELELGGGASGPAPEAAVYSAKVEDDVSIFANELLQVNYAGITAGTDLVEYSVAKNEAYGCSVLQQQGAGRGECGEIMEMLATIALQEEMVRVLGRKLQVSIAGFEMPLTEFPGRIVGLATLDIGKIMDILFLWSVGGGKYTIPVAQDNPFEVKNERDPYVAILNIPNKDSYKPLFDALGDALAEVRDPIERQWMIRRYAHGVRLARGERAPDYPAPEDDGSKRENTERQFAFGRWPKVEDALLAIWTKLQADLAGKKGYVDFEGGGGGNLWARVGPAKQSGKTPLPDDENGDIDDIGMAEPFPFEPPMPPVLPWGYYGCPTGTQSYGCQDDPSKREMILGGRYPPEPAKPDDGDEDPDETVWYEDPVSGLTFETVDGRGLCTHPRARRGFLCRPPKDEDCGSSSSGGAASSAPSGTSSARGGIAPCVRQTDKKTMPAENVCRETAWRQSPRHWGFSGSVVHPDDAYDINGKPFVDRLCVVDPKTDIQCGSAAFQGGQALPKREDGHIPIKLNDGTLPATYILLHELVHAEQACGQPVGSQIYQRDVWDFDEEEAAAGGGEEGDQEPIREQQENCCRTEGEAYRVNCQAMESDGVFDTPDARPVLDGVPLTPEVCAEVLTYTGCFQNLKAQCPVSRIYPDNFPEKPEIFSDKFLQWANARNPAKVPASCTDAIDPKKMDFRVRDAIARLNGRYDVCTPLNPVTYGNRIGNNLCYIAECAGEARDYHRVAGARRTAAAQDEPYPWDHFTETLSLAEIDSKKSDRKLSFPDYRPELLVQELDLAVCENAALPPLTPTIRCIVDPSRRLQTPLSNAPGTVQDLVEQLRGSDMAGGDLASLAPAVGLRVAAAANAGVAQSLLDAFARMLRTANDLLEEVRDITFPEQMCPFGIEEPRPVPSSARNIAP